MKLIISEKPSVAMEYAAALGVIGRNDGYIENGEYVITWCIGHLVGLLFPQSYDEKYKKWNIDDLPFLPQEYKYGVISSVKKQYQVVKKMLHRNDIDVVYWAGDAGKEGQVIEENIRMLSGIRSGMKELRIWIDSQTKEELLRGIREARPMSDYLLLAKSGTMRAIEDYAMGINFSRALTCKYGSIVNNSVVQKKYVPISVGRVMSCVLGMVVERERQIRNFVVTPYYKVSADIGDENITAEWKAVIGSSYYESPLLYKENGFKEESTAKQMTDKLNGKNAIIENMEQVQANKKAPLLFNLAELQSECSKKFKISPDETLSVAQVLYEKKLTTYPRTDARVLSSAIAKEIEKNIQGIHCGYPFTKQFTERILQDKSYINIGKTHYTDDSKITDHYAIIPTGQLSELSSLSELQKSVFDCIVKRFLSIFYPPAIFLTTKVIFQIDSEKFFTSSKTLVTKGYLNVMGISDEDNELSGCALSDFMKAHTRGDSLFVNELQIKQANTSPPKRYTSGTLILAMENAGQLIEDEELRAQIKGTGIGTSATRSGIIKKLTDISYININKKTQIITPEKLGEMIYEVIAATSPEMLNPRMTASWEKGLDGIELGSISYEDYRATLEDYISKTTIFIKENDLSSQITAKIKPYAAGASNKEKTQTHYIDGVVCPICQSVRNLKARVRVTAKGNFCCENYKKDGIECLFCIGSIAGKKLTELQAKTLINKGETSVIKGFMSNKGTKFSSPLIMINGQISFPKKAEPVLSDIICPHCHCNKLLRTQWKYQCNCGYALSHTICHKELPINAIKSLMENHTTVSKIDGLIRNDGKPFSAVLLCNDMGEIKFQRKENNEIL